MASPAKLGTQSSGPKPEGTEHQENDVSESQPPRQSPGVETSEQLQDSKDPMPQMPASPEAPLPFDWDDFERRYEQALRDADAHEKDVIKEAEGLFKYFKAWASAASAHDDERAAKRLQTRRRFVNLSEEKMEQKQHHYEDVVRAFESALALLQSK